MDRTPFGVVTEVHGQNPDGTFNATVLIRGPKYQETPVSAEHMNPETGPILPGSSDYPVGSGANPGYYPAHSAGPPPGTLSMAGAGRAPAAVVLRQKARALRGRADQLDALAGVADYMNPGSPEEAALWTLALSDRT